MRRLYSSMNLFCVYSVKHHGGNRYAVLSYAASITAAAARGIVYQQRSARGGMALYQ